MTEPHYEAIRSSLSGISSGSITGAFTTGSFAFTPEQMRDIITRWTNLAESYARSANTAVALANVEGPGVEYASQSHASVANESGRAYLRSLEEKWRYCLAQAQKFQDTLDDYLGVEHRNADIIKNAGAGPRDGI